MSILRWFRRRPTSFAPGQVWRYDTRPGEEQSRIHILRVDDEGARGIIVHIAVSGTHLGPIGHLPVAPAALEASGLRLESKRAPIPDYEQGYAIWREGFDNGKAGVFTISVAEIVGFVESTIR